MRWCEKQVQTFVLCGYNNNMQPSSANWNSLSKSVKSLQSHETSSVMVQNISAFFFVKFRQRTLVQNIRNCKRLSPSEATVNG